MKCFQTEFWGELGNVCGIIVAGLGLYYSIMHNTSSKGIKFIIGFAILTVVYVCLKKASRLQSRKRAT